MDASRKIPVAIRAAPTPMTIAQRNSDPVGDPTCGMEDTVSEKAPNPVRLLRPTKMSEPTPAARRPGINTISIIGPPSQPSP